MFDLTLSQALGVGIKKDLGKAASSKLNKVWVYIRAQENNSHTLK